MPDSFLYFVAEQIYSKHENELDKVLIVVPSTRAGRFIYNHLKTLIKGQVSWLPECKGISALVEDLSSINSSDRLELTLTLYKTHQKNNPDDSLESFLKWGGTALTDFNEIENYLLDGQRVFSDLRDIKEIEDWSFNEAVLSKDQTQFLEFWDYLGRLKSDFDAALKKEKTGYSGLIIRAAIEELENGNIPTEWKKIYFVGLNAISASEKRLITLLKLEGLAELISDSDSYYHDNPIQEAGYFMRKQEEFFDIKHVLSDYFKEEKEINFIKANTTLGMTSMAASLVSTNSENTALVLGDEKLLVPLLSSLPEEINEANITMGYPLTDGMVWRGIHKLFKLKTEMAKSEKASVSVLESLSNDPFISSLFLKTSVYIGRMGELLMKNRIGLTVSEVKKLFSEEEALRSIMESSSAAELLQTLNEFLEVAYRKYEHLSGFMKEQIAISHQFLQRLQAKISEVKELNTISNLSYFIDQLVNNEKVPFLGEPYGGIQIMGLLEARALDFEHVIFCGATDALMPAISAETSFIPFELKAIYGLPTNREKEAVFAYSFYRLLQRAKKADFIYVETEDGLIANEKSRFLTQLEHELPKYSPTVINYKTAQSETASEHLKETKITKTEEHREKIKALLARGISASAMNTFISCPADFYYKYIVGLKEPDKVDELVHASITGSILHNTLEELYKPLVGRVLSVSEVNGVIKNSVAALDAEVDSQNLTEVMSGGENKLEYLVMRQKLQNFLKWELSEVKKLEKQGKFITIVSLEQKYKAVIPGVQTPDGSPVTLSGFIDRIDRVGNELRIIDYKSGKVEQAELKLGEVLDFSGGKRGKALQLLVYGLLVGHASLEYLSEGFTVGNVSLKNISKGLINVTQGEGRKYAEVKITADFSEEIKESFNIIFQEMMHGIEYFQHEEEAKYCDFCLKD